LSLLAAAHSAGLITTLPTAVSAARPVGKSRLTHLRLESLQSLLLTLLFLGVVGLRRTWDLRSYTGDALALLTMRPRAYGYRHAERFLSQVASTGGVESLTDALACWTTCLWKATVPTMERALTVYIDGHRKPVYSEHLIRDLRPQMPMVSSEDVVPGARRGYTDLILDARTFWEQG
jgi:hypothetical protein